MVFAKTCKSVQLLSMTLNTLGFPSEALHSMRPQKERMSALATFRYVFNEFFRFSEFTKTNPKRARALNG